jgi:acetylornithine deacetylase/succinyl-diaminopimelate desuccinylase-like protein
MLRKEEIAAILDQLGEFEESARSVKDQLLANLVMISEIPAPSFDEENRIAFIKNRFIENELQHISIDELGNIAGMLPGKNPDQNILLNAHVDTVFSKKVDHTISVGSNKVTGPGVADNSLGVAVLVTLPELFKEAGIEFESNIWFLGETRSLGRGNLEGLRFFLEHSEIEFDNVICIEGAQLGRLSYSSVGMVRGEITASVPEEYDWMRMTYTNAIITINEVINRIVDIPLQQRPKTSIVMGSIEGGTTFNTIATKANLKFEIRSEDQEQVNNILAQFEDFVAEISSRSGIRVDMELVSERKPGGVSFKHPLPRNAHEIIKHLGLKPTITPSTSELSAFIDWGIPAITLGMTNAEHLRLETETIEIEPIYKGVAQLLGVINVIDKGD